MSKKKAAGKTKQSPNPNPKYLGVKVSDGETVNAGAILIRQRGTKVAAGKNVESGRDHTLFATTTGKVKFGQKLGKKNVSVL